jgi:ATP-dependent Clp protease adaptor protein ClpS
MSEDKHHGGFNWHLGDEGIDEDTATIDREDEKMAEPPPPWNVLLHNDDFTPIDFVVELLIDYFEHDLETAARIAKSIHEAGDNGRAIAKTYKNQDLAKTKAGQVITYCAGEGHPLMASAEQA